MLISIADYCQQRGVTRQFVYQYIKKGTFKRVDLPLFVEMGGEKKQVGTHTCIEVPEGLQPKLRYEGPALKIEETTSHSALKQFYKEYFALPKAERESFRVKTFAHIDSQPPAEKAAFYEAIEQANAQMLQDMIVANQELEAILKG
jgi:hypothetical protein